MLFNSEENGAKVSIQEKLIQSTKHYKCLGVTLSDREGYLDDDEDHLRLNGRRNTRFNEVQIAMGIQQV